MKLLQLILVKSHTVQESFLSDHAKRNFEIDYAKYIDDVRRYRNDTGNISEELHQ